MKPDAQTEIAVVANQIIQGRHRLNPRQQKIIAWAIGQIARDDKDFMSHRLSIAAFAKMTGATNSGSIYREMEQVTTSLLQEVLHIKINDGDRRRRKFQWLRRCDYLDHEGACEIQFHEELKPYLLELRNRFTQIRLDRFYQLKSSYTIRFFERIEMQRGLNRTNWNMTLEELRDWLNIDSKAYSKFGLLRANVLDVPQAELDLKSDWSFSFRPIKTGRKITSVEFTLRPARAPKVDPSRDRWAKASASLKARVFEAARNRTRWADVKDDNDILEDPSFWTYLNDLFDEVLDGQKALKLQS